ncbi:MAG: hypothetical protein K5898_13045 [Ruminococcus sp.]|uniref:hypothetical protein n=1 Tax=Ruminococcus sp. TaxID=41978 RepID=UPI0025F16DFC|nr:hypothetical protein [Ruminococcus sp.]MCR4796065.1 hypothetical protein [Ruminococcus sp.]
MGNFFTSTQIYNNEKLGKDEFIENFCSKMSEEGYVPCDDDDSEIAYILRFADNCNWVTITSEAYEQGNALSHKDTGRIAKMLGTTCVNTVVIDSDCAILELYDKNGKKADTFTIGRADDYFGDDIPQPSEKIWKSFLSKDSSWEQFTKICSSDEVFVEDGISKLAQIIGMDSCNITFSAENADEMDTSCVFLDFKSARSFITMSCNGKTMETQPKKLTLNAAFKSVYGEFLEPYGFKLLKSKYPYFVRIIDDDIIQMISITKEKSLMNKDDEGFSICIGVSLMSLPLTDFDKTPMSVGNRHIGDLMSLYHNYSLSFDVDKYAVKQFSFFYKKGDNGGMLSAMNESQQKLMPFVLVFFEETKNLEYIYKLVYSVLFGLQKDVVVLAQKVDEFLAYRGKVFPEELKNIVTTLENNPFMCPLAEKKKAEAIEKNNSFIQWFVERKVGGAEYDNYIKQANEKKNENTEILKSYGLI